MGELIETVWLPQALCLGVDYNLFWTLTPKKLTPFVTAFEKQRQYEQSAFEQKTNFAAWLGGIYIAKAIASNFSKNTAYFRQPIDLGPAKQSDTPCENIDAVRFEAWATAFNSNIATKAKNNIEEENKHE